MDKFETINGYLWPAADTECRRVIFDWSTDLELVYGYVDKFGVCVQAGGNCGVWPKMLADKFEVVYTFEPDATNFHCLAHNCPDDNIVKMQAALGNHLQPPVGIKGKAKNCGAHQVTRGGIYPVISIDALCLPACDLIYLDIEGYEGEAIKGAQATIMRHQPIIAIENKGHSNEYGISEKGLEKLIISFGYEVVARPHRDVIFRPCA